jgi:hypothetical protein
MLEFQKKFDDFERKLMEENRPRLAPLWHPFETSNSSKSHTIILQILSATQKPGTN